MLAWSMWNDFAFKWLAVQKHLADTLADSIRILYRDLVLRATETAVDGVLLPLRADAWIDLKTVV